MGEAALFKYLDPPYIGCAHLYKDHPDYGGEVDHVDLLREADATSDGWALHCSSTSLEQIHNICAEYGLGPYRTMAWVKPFAAFKKNVSVAYAWEPVLVKPVRKPVVSGRDIMRDWIACPITLKKGLTGAKPEAVCRWVFEVAGLEPTDEMVDVFPGTGAVSRAWEGWRSDVLGGVAPKRVRTLTEARAEIEMLRQTIEEMSLAP